MNGRGPLRRTDDSASWCECMLMFHRQHGRRTSSTTAADASRASPAPGVVRVAASGRRDGRHTTRRWVAAARPGRRVVRVPARRGVGCPGRWVARRWVAAARSGRRVVRVPARQGVAVARSGRRVVRVPARQGVAAARSGRWVVRVPARQGVAAARSGRWVAVTRPRGHIGADLVEISDGAPQTVPALIALGVGGSKVSNDGVLARGVGMILAHRAEIQNVVHVPTAGAVRLDDAHGCGLCNECLIS